MNRFSGNFYAGLNGGARGLRKLSLAECRQITDQGVGYLRKLKQLSELNLLGCYSLTDNGLGAMMSGATAIERLNISGSCVTRDGLQLIAQKLPRLIELTANCCKLLTAADSGLISRATVHIYEDIFRFQLEPTPGSKLPSITSNVLRTRSSLSILRVSKYICRRLERNDIDVDVRTTQVVFADKVLTPYQTLQEISSQFNGAMLALEYRLKEESTAIEQLKKLQGRLVHLPVWVGDDASDNCQQCSTPFGMLRRRHHCRRCGSLLCGACTTRLEFVPELGYTKDKVRVCFGCCQERL